MRKFYFSLLVLISSLYLHGCAAGPGTGEGSTGSAGLSMQLVELGAGESFQTADGFNLNFNHFALAFTKLGLGGEEVVEGFSADFFDEEVIDIIEIEDLPAGEYDDLILEMGIAGAAGKFAKTLQARNLKHAETIPDELDGHSAFIEAEVSNGTETCTLSILLDLEGAEVEVDPAGNHVEIVAGEEAEILVVVDPNAIFGGVDIAALCIGGVAVSISSSENPDLASELATHLPESFALGSTEGHDHGHSH